MGNVHKTINRKPNTTRIYINNVTSHRCSWSPARSQLLLHRYYSGGKKAMGCHMLLYESKMPVSLNGSRITLKRAQEWCSTSQYSISSRENQPNKFAQDKTFTEKCQTTCNSTDPGPRRFEPIHYAPVLLFELNSQ